MCNRPGHAQNTCVICQERYCSLCDGHPTDGSCLDDALTTGTEENTFSVSGTPAAGTEQNRLCTASASS